jgi:hypothetical protein
MDLDFRNKRHFTFEFNGERVRCIRRSIHRFSNAEISAGSADSNSEHWVYLYLAGETMSPKMHLFHIDEALVMQAVMAQTLIRDMDACIPDDKLLPMAIPADSIFFKSNLS